MRETPSSGDLAASCSPVISNGESSPIDDALIIVCAWCEQEGKTTILHPLSSVDHSASAWDVQSHGICQAHYDQVLAEFVAEA